MAKKILSPIEVDGTVKASQGTSAGEAIVLDENGSFPSTMAVTSFNGNTGDITYTPPVTSVNSKTGAVSLGASDVGALADTTAFATINGTSVKGNTAFSLQAPLTFDTTPTADSTNPVTSDGIKTFVNSSIATNTANFKGTFDVVNDLGLTTSATDSQIATALAGKSLSPTNNDYVFVYFDYSADPGNIDKYERFKYNGTAWAYEYTLNNSSFTAQQWATINTVLGTAATCNTGTSSGNIPILDSNGKLNVDTTGNAATATSATSATQDGSGNTIATFYQKKHGTATATLTTGGWSSNTQTVSVTGVTSSNTVQWGVNGDPTVAGEAGVYCSAQGSGTLTFTCASVPSANISINVVIFT